MKDHNGPQRQDAAWAEPPVEQACCCLIYQLNEERDHAVVRHLQNGLDQQQKIVLLIAEPLQGTLRAGLEQQGLPLVELEGCGRLEFVSPDDLGLRSVPSSAAMVAGLAALERNAKAQGFAGARVYWEMTGALLAKDLDWWRECIEGWSQLTACADIAVLSGFDRRQVSSDLLVEALRFYPTIIHQGQLYRNSYYPSSAAKAAVEASVSPRRPGSAHHKRDKRPYRRGQVLDAIFAAAPIGLWLLDKEQRMIFINRNFCDMAGLSEEQILQAEHYSQIMRPEEVVECMLSDAQAFNADGPVECEEVVTTPEGKQHVYQVVKTKIVNEEQEAEGLLGLAIDITERKETERRLRQSEARFRDIVFSMADFTWEVDADGRFSYCSDKVEEMLGYTAEEMYDRRCFELMSYKEGRRLEGLFSDNDWPRQPFRNLESWAFDRDGKRHFLRISGVPIVAEDGSFCGYRGVTEDITEHRRSEVSMKKALAAAEQARDQVDSIIQSTADGLIVTDPRSHRIVLINDTAQDLLNIGRQDLAGEPIAAAVQDEGLLQQIAAIYGADTPPLLQADFPLTANGSFLQARTSLMRNKLGRVSGAITVLRDVTRERELDRQKGEFMSMAAHELRTPLTAILGYSELCMNPEEFGGFNEAQQKEFMAEIHGKAEVLANLVNDLLDVTRLEAGKPLPLHIEGVEIGRTLAKVVDRHRLQAPKHHFEIVLADNTPQRVRADAERLEQVLENLVGNAVKYSPEGSLVRISAERGAGCCRIMVSDQGIGMTPQQVERMFDKFYRADFSDTAASGLGLGMSIVKQIIEQHGGVIRVESAKGAGTRVMFTVPDDG